MSSPKIKPYPFCGGLADIRYSFDTLLIECTNKNCKLQPSTWSHVHTNNAEKLIKIWNKRKDLEEQEND
ncbi:Lar family restriction alleviation protein [Staphylococcus aureus]|uniref:Lar family restriction alleviation protein n=1 Tax=Staphylococcus aureus TaxID=1280 RepID=UPI0007C9FDAE|nr:Lar family restriction alleviation protein [Staphylococcus aureus]SAO88983.1 phage protein [Staphylococcus aureus]HDC9808320.1 Lar family restriction alleviation protein [Staphylococcus aureus]HDJ6096729.1 Lar family restriction alleviation protein [Staphylococcus aureus]